MSTRTLALLLLFVPAAFAQDAAEIRGLVADLGSSDFERREEATKGLEALGEAARPYLEEGLASDDLEVRLRVRGLLARIDFAFLAEGRLAAWNPDLARALLSPEEATRLQAARQLAGRLGAIPPEARGEARRVFARIADRWKDEPEAPERRTFVEAIARLGDAERILEIALGVVDADLEPKAFRNFGRKYRGDAAGLLEAMARAEGKARIAIAGWFLASLVRAKKPLELDETSRARAIDLARTVDVELAPAARLVKGGIPVRLGALDGIPDLAAFAAAKPQARRWVADCFAASPDAASRAEALAHADGLGEVERSALAAVALGWFTDEEAELESAWFDHGSPLVREVACRAALHLDLPDREEELEGLLDDPAPRVRVAAATALVSSGAEEKALGALLGSLASEDAVEVREALRALALLEHDELGARATALLADPRPDVRAAAACALVYRKSARPSAEAGRVLGDEAACLYYSSRQAPLRAGTVDAAVRASWSRRTKEELPAGTEAAREAIGRWLEARAEDLREKRSRPEEEEPGEGED